VKLEFINLRLCTLLMVLGALWFRSAFALIEVDGNSMEPNFANGEIVLVWKRAYQADDPQRGDVVVGQQRNELIIKRVVGLPGETVEILKGQLKVNGSKVVEEYPLRYGLVEVGRGELKADRYALFGDNRDVPKDQTIAAVLPKQQILGKVVGSLSPSKLGSSLAAAFPVRS
jgi:signal peptidase I